MVLLAKAREGNDAVVRDRDPPVVNWTRGHYKHLLRGIVAHPKSAIAVAALVTLAGSASCRSSELRSCPTSRRAISPSTCRRWRALPSPSSQRLGGLVTGALTELPMVRSVAQRIGRAEKAEDTWGTHYSEFEVALKAGLSGDETEHAQAELRRALIPFPGVNFVLKPFLTERIEEILSGYTASVVVNIFGNNLDLLDLVARDVARVIGGIHGATEVQLQSPPGMPQLTIRLRKQDLERWGFDAIGVLDVIRAAYQGDVVGQTYEGNRVFNVIVALDPQNRNDIMKVGNLSLRTPGGTYILLRQIADIYQSAGRYQVAHLGAQRLQTVTANVAGRMWRLSCRTPRRCSQVMSSCRAVFTSSSPVRRRRRRSPDAIFSFSQGSRGLRLYCCCQS
jgi:Cu/Ag efflux pump CusA